MNVVRVVLRSLLICYKQTSLGRIWRQPSERGLGGILSIYFQSSNNNLYITLYSNVVVWNYLWFSLICADVMNCYVFFYQRSHNILNWFQTLWKLKQTCIKQVIRITLNKHYIWETIFFKLSFFYFRSKSLLMSKCVRLLVLLFPRSAMEQSCETARDIHNFYIIQIFQKNGEEQTT